MTHRRLERAFQVDVGGQNVAMATTVHLPAKPDPTRPVLFLYPGAGYARGYFDIRVDGFEDYSEAAHHVGQGMIAVAIDHVGVGESLHSGEGLTFPLMGVACDGAARAALAELRAGTLDPAVPPMPNPTAIGVGQSMGGAVLAYAQAGHVTFHGMAALGTSFTQTRLGLKPGKRYPPRDTDFATMMAAMMADTDMASCFHWAETPQALVDADMTPGSTAPWRSPTIPTCTHELMAPGALTRVAAEVRVPVLLAYGEVDVTLEPLADVAAFRSTGDISLLIQRRMAHMHNFAPTRRKLWRRLTQFAEAVAQARD